MADVSTPTTAATNAVPESTSASQRVQAGSTTYISKLVGANRRECLVPEQQPDNLEFTFVPKTDPSSGRSFFVNVLTRNRVWSLPDITAIGTMPPLAPTVQRCGTTFTLCRSADGETLYAPKQLPVTLQPGHCWLPRGDRVHLRYYYLNAVSKEKVMFLPPTVDLLERVRAMYDYYTIGANDNTNTFSDPAAATTIASPFEDAAVEWAGREQQLLANLVLLHGPEPARMSTVLEVVDAYVENTEVLREQLMAVVEQTQEGEAARSKRTPQELLQALEDAFGPPPKTKRQRVLAMYHHYAPDLLHQADEVLAQHSGPGPLSTLLDSLVEKWGPEPGHGALYSPRGNSTTGERSTDQIALEERVMAMLAVHDPDNLHKAQEYMAVFRGKERELLETLVRRFGPEPSATTSRQRMSGASSWSSSPRSQSAQSLLLKSPTEGNGLAWGGSAVHIDPAMHQTEGEAIPVEPDEGGGGQYRQRLLAFYKRYNPGKLTTVDETLRKYAGQEDFLLDQLVRKYGPEPSMGGSPRASPRGVVTSSFAGGDGGAAHTSAASGVELDAHHSAGKSLHQRITDMYQYYASEQLASVESTLALYDGDEQALLDALVGAYGSEPTQEQLAEAIRLAEEGAARATRKRGQSLVDQTRSRVSNILRTHAPDEITHIDEMLAEYAGREDVLIDLLSSKYCPQTSDERLASTQEEATSLEDIRLRIAAKARAENQAFLKQLDDEMGPVVSTGGATPPSVARPRSIVVDDAGGPGAPSPGKGVQEGAHTPPQAAEVRMATITPSMLLASGTGVGQLYNLEQRLHEALDATERTLRRNELLHEENVRLSNAQRQLQHQCEDEIRAVQSRLEAMQAEASRMQHEFALERIQLKMQEEGAVLSLKQETQEERAKYIEAHLQTLAERKQLEQLLMEAKASLAQCDANSRSLEARIKRRETELDDARAEVKFLTIQLDRSNCEDASTQTDAQTPHKFQGSLEPRHGFGTLDAEHTPHSRDSDGRGNSTIRDISDVQALKQHCAHIERELEIVRANHREAMNECDNAAKFINILKTKKRRLEDRVATLELRELALPDAPPSKSEMECRRLEEEVAMLQGQLHAADAESRRSKREIAELRSLLALHMSGATGMARQASRRI